MFHSLKCHWELGSTFIRRFCHFRTRFVILDPTSSSLELVGVVLALEWFRAGSSSHFSHSSRSCALGPTLLPKERAEGRTWCCGSILISGMKFPNSLGNFIGLSCLSLLFPFSPRSLCCHLWEPTDFWGLFSIMRGQKWMSQALFYFLFHFLEHLYSRKIFIVIFILIVIVL